ncbi:MAG TPA: autotransporter outer membrane beta-barrel domain-containing protein, partial [Pseudomonas sp.]|nr:autotransporter outer membrane beta-barrel domain-containing protein [Pseudomonas sp.]
YDSKRELGGGLGAAKGDTEGTLAGASLALGYRMPMSGVTFEPSLGVRVSRVDLDGFQEKGSELALQVDDLKETRRAAFANVKATFAPQSLGAGWQLTPGIELGYEHALGDDKVDSEGHLLGLDVAQRAAFDSRDQFGGSFNLNASLGDFSVGAEVGVIAGGNSHGASGNLKASYQF